MCRAGKGRGWLYFFSSLVPSLFWLTLKTNLCAAQMISRLTKAQAARTAAGPIQTGPNKTDKQAIESLTQRLHEAEERARRFGDFGFLPLPLPHNETRDVNTSTKICSGRSENAQKRWSERRWRSKGRHHLRYFKRRLCQACQSELCTIRR